MKVNNNLVIISVCPTLDLCNKIRTGKSAIHISHIQLLRSPYTGYTRGNNKISKN